MEPRVIRWATSSARANNSASFMLTVCYFGIYNPDFSRNRVYLKGLRLAGVRIVECRDTTPGVRKFWNLFWKHRALRDTYDVMVVGYPGHLSVLWARLLTRKPIVLDALCSFYESEILSRDAFRSVPGRKFFARLLDFLANRSADLILVESEAQRQYYVRALHIPAHRCVSLYTSVDDEEFAYDPRTPKRDTFTAIFRGRITLEAGITTVVEAARLLADKGVNIVIVGFGFGAAAEEFARVTANPPVNLSIVNRHLPLGELLTLMQSCHISLGQFGLHPRLSRTIPHKIYESLALCLPIVTARTAPIQELLTDQKDGVLVEVGDPHSLAKALLRLRDDVQLRERLASAGMKLFQVELQPAVLGRKLTAVLTDIVT